MPLEDLRDVLEDLLRDLYHAEKQLTRALPKMAKAATFPDLKAAFEEHLEVTEGQIERLEQVFEALELPVKAKKCIGMEGVIEEGNEVIQEKAKGSPAAIDAALIVAAQKVEHYEMAGYGSARTFAMILGEEQAAQLLQETLDEEGEADKKLSALAEQINEAAEDEEQGEEESDGDEEEGEMEMASAAGRRSGGRGGNSARGNSGGRGRAGGSASARGGNRSGGSRGKNR